VHIVADETVALAAELLGPLGRLTILPPPEITRARLTEADALVVRSTVRVGRDLLDGTPVRFVGTATSGTDHVDEEWLKRAGIAFASAPGCNARAVAEYVVAAILFLAERDGWEPAGRTLGVVGVGHVGSRVVELGRALGMNVLMCDPPLARSGLAGSVLTGSIPARSVPARSVPARSVPARSVRPPSRTSSRRGRASAPAEAPGPFLDLADLLRASEVVTLHVPLTHTGPDATFHMVNGDSLKSMRRGTALINTARGGVAESAALVSARQSGHLAGLVLDVWEGEPRVDPDLLDAADIMTPHIAGYSIEGKENGTRMIAEALAEFARGGDVRLGGRTLRDVRRDGRTVPDARLRGRTPNQSRRVSRRPVRRDAWHGVRTLRDETIFNPESANPIEAVTRVVAAVCDLAGTDAAFRRAAAEAPPGSPDAFAKCRENYPLRGEFASYQVDASRAAGRAVSEARELLGTLGFRAGRR
jgi:erythronate-4-phosphate dehydrogenase